MSYAELVERIVDEALVSARDRARIDRPRRAAEGQGAAARVNTRRKAPAAGHARRAAASRPRRSAASAGWILLGMIARGRARDRRGDAACRQMVGTAHRRGASARPASRSNGSRSRASTGCSGCRSTTVALDQHSMAMPLVDLDGDARAAAPLRLGQGSARLAPPARYAGGRHRRARSPPRSGSTTSSLMPDRRATAWCSSRSDSRRCPICRW